MPTIFCTGESCRRCKQNKHEKLTTSIFGMNYIPILLLAIGCLAGEDGRLTVCGPSSENPGGAMPSMFVKSTASRSSGVSGGGINVKSEKDNLNITNSVCS